jgi:hypothetical protein
VKILAFGHEKSVGKDTSSRFVTTHSRTVLRMTSVYNVGFSDKIKDIGHQLYSWAGLRPGAFYDEPANYHLKDVVLPSIGCTPRKVWIEIGQRMKERIWPSTWTDYLFKGPECDLMIIKDLRFPVEVEAIHERGGKVFKIERPSVPHTSDEADDPLLGFTGWDGVIINDGSLHQLHDRVIASVGGYISGSSIV